MIEDEGRQVVDAVVLGEARPCGHVQPGRQAGGSHLPRVRSRGVEDRASRPVDGAGVRPIERSHVLGVDPDVRSDVGQPLPAATDAEHVVAGLGRAVHHALDDRIETGDVAAAGQDPDSLGGCHGHRIVRFARVSCGLRPGCTVSIEAGRS